MSSRRTACSRALSVCTTAQGSTLACIWRHFLTSSGGVCQLLSFGFPLLRHLLANFAHARFCGDGFERLMATEQDGFVEDIDGAAKHHCRRADDFADGEGDVSAAIERLERITFDDVDGGLQPMGMQPIAILDHRFKD